MEPRTAGDPARDAAADPVVQPFAEFYREQYRRCFALGLALSGSASTAGELVQDAFADAHRRWDRVGAYDKPKAWVRRAVLNRATSLRRRWARRQRALPRLQIVTSVGIDARDEELWRRVRALPPRQAQLVALVCVDGLTVAGAAEALGLAPSTAATHLARAKQHRRIQPVVVHASGTGVAALVDCHFYLRSESACVATARLMTAAASAGPTRTRTDGPLLAR